MRIDLLLKGVGYLKNKRSDCIAEPLCLQCLDVADKSIWFAFPAQLLACSIAFLLVCPCKQADEHMLALALKKTNTVHDKPGVRLQSGQKEERSPDV